MSFKCLLTRAIDCAVLAVLSGYEIEEANDFLLENGTNAIRLSSCDGEYEFFFPLALEIEVDSDGHAEVVDIDGNTYHLELKNYRPFNEGDL